MGIVEASIYGIIQGLTEFLPVSSSGHLALLPSILTIKDPGVSFDLAMHLGTALAIMCYFHRDIYKLIKNAFLLLDFKSPMTSDKRSSLHMIIATFSTGVIALCLKDFAENYGRDNSFIAFNLVFFGALMWISDVKFKEREEGELLKKESWKSALLIGIFQSFALFPGVSRSGITLTTARFLSISRNEASRFSFLLSLPLIIGGALLKYPEIVKGNEAFNLMSCFMGVFVSFVVGLLTIHYFLKFIKKIGLLPFAIYRFIIALLVILIL
ncbi:undecaprenyl-diphosphatase UppP [Halobacteriovorax marinus]|uniref:Undecaprenyl-diphosphatase n=1 Tax=Halobacteriovorax marinus (strain ATCC BAA-682 / DSM 15412 / SJ) TaxID=862908 RepID=E1X2L9_HALMS|nr:undecaprenyl-diphosphatase UppP [Halobacteriovorax marinus]ATH08125.1 undecaprenyl-diphosphatase UppP [Halobacteriovorax marinus]CBW26786.1 undecaprenyl-diphosphatase (Undecaprenyl pyrophosphate phosphatase) (Bacitracin resistance protein) [Halobacteriovorax marinus SJ]